MKGRMIRGLLAVMLVFFAVSAEAEEEKTTKLEEVVVSASRTEIPVFDAAQSVTVLSKEEIADSPFERIEDIVRSVPGISNFRHFALQTNGIVSPLMMRGVGQNRVLVLVDGVPQNDNFNNAIAWVGWGHIPKETIERIEIVRGPTSSLYGSEGLGGIIHIITKKPNSQRQTSVRAEVGTSATYGGFGYHNQKINDFGMMIAGGYEESDGFYMTDLVESYTLKRYREVGKVMGKITYDLNPKSDISLAALYYDHYMGQGREYFHNELQLDQYWLNYRQQGDTLDIKALAYLNHADKTAYQDSTSDNYKSLFRIEKYPASYAWGADLQGTLSVSKWLKWTFGATFKENSWEYDEDYTTSKRDAGAEGKQQTISPFTNLDFRFFDNALVVNIGARYDRIETSDGANWDTKPEGGLAAYNNHYDTQHEDNFSPKLGIAYHPDDKTTLRVSGGKGFRSPSLFELYKVHVRGGGTYYRAANPNLNPEELWSYDIGAERFFTDKIWGKASFYQSFASDYIGDRLTRQYVKSNKTYYEYILDNISKVNIHGIEAELQWFPANDYTLFANYTYNVSEVDEDETNKSLEGNYLPNNPRHSFHTGIRYQNPAIVNVSFQVNYYADIYYDNENTLKTGDYWTADASVSRKFFNSWIVYLNIENMFDKEYPIFLSTSSGNTIAPGLIASGGVKFEF